MSEKSRMSTKWLVTFILVFVLFPRASGQTMFRECGLIVKPLVESTSFESSNREWVCRATPDYASPPYGARYELRHQNRIWWEQTKCYRLGEIAVNDKGYCAGIGYDYGLDNKGLEVPCLHLVFFSPEGRELGHEVIPRPELEVHFFPAVHSPPYVRTMSMSDNRVMFRMVEPFGLVGSNTIRIYDATTGKLINKIDEAQISLIPESFSLNAAIISDTPLILIHWYSRIPHSTCGQRAEGIGHFTVIDTDGKVCWSSSDDHYDGDYCRFTNPPAFSINRRTSSFKLQFFGPAKTAVFRYSKTEHGYQVLAHVEGSDRKEGN
jgi:hypothetical protein